MKSEVNIEWLVEELDMTDVDDIDDAEIIDPHHFDTYADAERFAKNSDHLTRIGLVRDRGNDLDGLIDRQWAYITGGKLPERFDWGGGETNGALVPARYHSELKASGKLVKRVSLDEIFANPKGWMK